MGVSEGIRLGKSLGGKDGVVVGTVLGLVLGCIDGEVLGTMLGLVLGLNDGEELRTVLGISDGVFDGNREGMWEGAILGIGMTLPSIATRPNSDTLMLTSERKSCVLVSVKTKLPLLVISNTTS